MYSVEVYSTLFGSRITRFLTFDSYSAAVNCIQNLTGSTLTGVYYPEDYFQTAAISSHARGEVVNNKPIETDLVINYLEKTVDF